MVKANENIKTKTTVKTTEKGKTINEVTKLTNPPINKPTTPKTTTPSPAPPIKAPKSPSPAPPNPKTTKSPSPVPPNPKTTRSPSPATPSRNKEQPKAATQTSGTKLELKLEGFKKIRKGQAAYNIKLEATQQSFDETAGPKHKVFGRRGSKKAEKRLAFDANINLHAGKGTEEERELKEDPTAVTTDPPTAKDIGTIDPKIRQRMKSLARILMRFGQSSHKGWTLGGSGVPTFDAYHCAGLGALIPNTFLSCSMIFWEKLWAMIFLFGTVQEAANYSFLKKNAEGKISTEEEQPAAIPDSIMTDFDLFEKSKKMLNDFKKLEEFFGKDKPQVTAPQKKQAATKQTVPTAKPARSTSVAKGVNVNKKSQKENINDARRKRTAASLISKPMPVLASILKGKMSTRSMSTQKTLPSKEG